MFDVLLQSNLDQLAGLVRCEANLACHSLSQNVLSSWIDLVLMTPGLNSISSSQWYRTVLAKLIWVLEGLWQFFSPQQATCPLFRGK